jgi:hypothetical protein
MTTLLLDRLAPATVWPAEPVHRHLRDCWWDVMRACWSCAPVPRRTP